MEKTKRLKRLSVQGVYVLPDFSSTCLWNSDGGGMLYPRELGLSCKTVNALNDFERYYDDVATGRPSYRVLKSHEKSLNAMGKKIAEDIKAEKPSLVVEYWGEYAEGKIKKVKIKGA